MKKILAILLVVVMAATAIIGGTLAYFTDTGDVTNTFEMGNVDITLDEAVVEKVEDSDEWEPTDDRTEEGNDYGQVYPGAVLPKDPTIHNVGNSDAYVWATVNVSNWANIYVALGGDATDEAGLTKLIGDTLGEGWSIYSAGAGDTLDWANGIMDAKYVLKYEPRLAAGESTTAMFETITVPAEFTNDSAEWDFETIKVEGFAIQAEGFGTWQDAYDAYNAA